MDAIKDTYFTIEEESEGLYKEKGSKFISYALPVSNVDEIKEILAGYRKQYYDARHVCYAYRLGYEGEEYRMNDDGEPSGTAGKPIYGQLLSHQVTNLLVVVIRYFGGTKLGVSGLIHAYKEATIEALANNNIEEKIIYKPLTLKFGYPLMNEVMRIVKAQDLNVSNQNFELDCTLILDIRISMYQNIYEQYKKLEGVSIAEDDLE